MKQILHIFKKDGRQFRLEILLCLAIVAAFAVMYPRQWSSVSYGVGAVVSFGFMLNGGIEVIASLLVFLVPVGWWILITRVVHGENLVGDRQFWVTRPYEWKKLFAAKAFFLLAFLYLPIFFAQCVLLKAAGFQPHSYIPGLLFNLLLITGFLVLPFFALATVTASFSRTTLTLVAILLGFVGFSILSSALYTSHITSSNSGVGISGSLLVVICAVVPVVQYATRRVWLSRLLLLVIPVSMCVLSFASPDDAIIYNTYPRAAGSQVPLLQFALDADVNQGTARWDRSSKFVTLNIPLKVSGVEEGTAIQSDNVMLSIDVPNGQRWTSRWQSAYGRRYLPGTQASEAEVNVSREFYDHVGTSPVTLHLTFAVTELRSGSISKISLPMGRFPVSRVGICFPDVSWDTLYITGISCLSALHQPALNYVSVFWSSARCSDNPTPQSTRVQGAGWIGALDNSPADFGITSVWRTPVNLSNNGTETRVYTPENRHLCPGTSVTFTPYDSVGRTQTYLTIPDFRLPSYLPEKVNP